MICLEPQNISSLPSFPSLLPFPLSLTRPPSTGTHLRRRDPILQPRPHTIPRDLARHKVREPAPEADEQVQHGDLERVRRVRVDFVVGLDDEEAAFFVGVAGGDEGRGGGGEGCGEAGGVEGGGVALWDMGVSGEKGEGEGRTEGR